MKKVVKRKEIRKLVWFDGNGELLLVIGLRNIKIVISRAISFFNSTQVGSDQVVI